MSQPPSDGPAMSPRYVIIAWRPSTRPRRSGGKLPVRMAAELERSIAAPTAWRARKAIRASTPGDSPHSMELATKPPKPSTYTLLCPRTSPSRPKPSSSPLTVSRYTVTTHSMVATSVRSWARSTGRIAFTTLPSSADMKVPVPTASSTQRPERSPGTCVIDSLTLEP